MHNIDWKILWKSFGIAVIAITLAYLLVIIPQRNYIQIFVYLGSILLITSAIYFLKTVTTNYFASMLFGGVMTIIIAVTLLLVSLLLERLFGIDFLNLKLDLREFKFIW